MAEKKATAPAKPAAAKRAAPAKTTAPKAAAAKTAAPKTATKAAMPKAATKPMPKPTVAAAPSGESFRAQASSFKGKASDKAREYADTGKDKATTILDNLSKTVEELARSVDERLGTTYGDYTRKAADAVSSAATTLKGKDVDDIVADTREFVRTRPAVAIGAAAAVGFLLTRLIKAGSNDQDDA